MNVSGSPYDYLIAFFAGVVVSFSPCVFPLLPVSVAYIGANDTNSRFKGLGLSLIYVLGLALTYSFLGAVASLTGRMFGVISSHPFTYIVVGIVIGISGLFMLDVLQLKSITLVKLPKPKPGNYLSVFFLGLVSGLVVSPCTTPVLGAILGYLALKKNVLYGSALLFCFAYGLGAVLIVAATFSSLLLSLPKSGGWMVRIRHICAGIMILVGLFFIMTGIRRI